MRGIKYDAIVLDECSRYCDSKLAQLQSFAKRKAAIKAKLVRKPLNYFERVEDELDSIISKCNISWDSSDAHVEAHIKASDYILSKYARKNRLYNSKLWNRMLKLTSH